ncbi:MAG: cell division protein FtsA [Acidobacteria bacterium]|nr:cell division protein FtsA [Acidobacteriota bacterium]
MAKNLETLAAIDLGTYRSCCVIAEVTGPESLEVVGIGTTRTDGIRKGVIVNLEALVACIRRAVEQAESMGGRRVETALATVPAAQARSFTSRGVVTIGSRDRVVTRRDLERVFETVRAVQIPAGQSILHVMPQEYTLDGQEGIQDPVGMSGARLEGSFHIVTVPQQAAQHVVTALNQAQIEVASLVYPLLASAETVLSREEREQGVLLIDCGGGTTDVALFERGALWFTGTIPVAGDLITNDLSIGLRTPVPDAELLKRAHARAVAGQDDDVALEVPTVGGGQPRVVPRSLLTQVVSPRVMEIYELVRNVVDRFGLHARARSGAVIVGGSANLEGMLEVAEQVLQMPVRLGVPVGIGGLVEEIRAPSFASPVGLLRWELVTGRRKRAEEAEANRGWFRRLGAGARRASGWLGEMF